MKTSNLILLLAVLFSLNSFSAENSDATAGKSKSAACIACHGADGISLNGLWPNLAGQKEDYLKKQLHAFKEGGRLDPIMSGFAKTLSDQDIKDLATYFSHLKGS